MKAVNRSLFTWFSKVEIERRRRIQVSLWAYAYEIENNPIVSDQVFDEQCSKIDLSIMTGHSILDKWFIENFTPYTGQWIYKHPELNLLKQLYERVR
ncbi:MAG: hypothetical protein CMC15_18660 [Flavobacteriaceae bacterium]|nr:hypothetical protein [Flavobacteriaceae bacterium]